MSSSADAAPDPDEIEITVFGPGVGECVVVHLGGGDWMVVDSCLDAGEPVASKYLARLEVPMTSVRHVIVTHWHDDHIRGAANVLEAATNATFHCSKALNRDEFLRLIKANQTAHVDTGTSEMERMLRILKSRAPRGHRVEAASIGPDWVTERQVIYRSARATVWALSPSAATMTLAKHEIGRLVPVAGPKRNVVAQKANKLAVVLRIDVGSAAAVLLGSDLESSTNPLVGWTAVVTAAGIVGSRRGCVWKVAHHGSPAAHDDAAWAALVEQDAHAATTPFHPSGLPSDADRARIRNRTPNAYVTARSSGRRPARRDMQAILDATVRGRRELATQMGHVRFRMITAATSAADVRVELFGAAFRLG